MMLEVMRPWSGDPYSIAHGILDDEVYDWRAILDAIERRGGGVIVVSEDKLKEANDVGRRWNRFSASHTGTAGLAGLLAAREEGLFDKRQFAVTLFTGR